MTTNTDRWRKRRDEVLLDEIIRAATVVHQQVLAGRSETTWRRCLAHELGQRGLEPVTDVPVDLLFRGTMVPDSFRLGLLVAERIVVEVKVTDQLTPEHEAQLRTCLRLSGHHAGLLLNFGASTLEEGARRVMADASSIMPPPHTQVREEQVREEQVREDQAPQRSGLPQ
jgi:GxxExxY protein